MDEVIESLRFQHYAGMDETLRASFRNKGGTGAMIEWNRAECEKRQKDETLDPASRNAVSDALLGWPRR